MFLRIIFLLLLFYIIFNLIKQVFYIGVKGMKGMKGMRGGNPHRPQNMGEGVNLNRKNNQDKVIELDKDQYKIE